LIAIIWVWHCVVYGQLAVSNFHPYNPYNIPHYTSTIISQPTNQNYAEMEAQLLGGTDELGNIPNTRNSPFQGVIFFQIKRHQATMAKLAKQLKGMNRNVAFLLVMNRIHHIRRNNCFPNYYRYN
jgi:hypothetical protein